MTSELPISNRISSGHCCVIRSSGQVSHKIVHSGNGTISGGVAENNELDGITLKIGCQIQFKKSEYSYFIHIQTFTN